MFQLLFASSTVVYSTYIKENTGSGQWILYVQMIFPFTLIHGAAYLMECIYFDYLS